MLLIKIENNVVIDIIDSDRHHDEYTKIPDDCFIGVGEDIRGYDSSWKLRPLQDRIDDGLITLTEFEKVDGENIVQKTRYDLAKEGKVTLSANEYLDDDAKEIKSGPIPELYAIGKITEAKYDEWAASNVRGERDRLLYKVDAIVMNPLRWAATPQEQQVELGEYRQALLDVPQQAGFPHDVYWPDTPEALKAA
jgi:hypothetical protein